MAYGNDVVAAPGGITEAKDRDDIESSPSRSQEFYTEKNDQDTEKKGGLNDYPELGHEVTLQQGEHKFHKLGWKKLTICLIVEAIALGSLSIPKAFATLGMIPGVILCIGLGLLAIYTGFVVGEVKLKYPAIEHYADAVKLIWGKPGYELTGVMIALFLILLVGSHALTGTIAFVNIIDKPDVCALVFGIVSAIILFAVALPPTFSEFAILGYIDFVSIIVAILITIIATGVQAHKSAHGLSGVDWHLWPQPDVTLVEAFLATTNIIFAYSFAVTQFSFMSEMHTPTDFRKSIWALGLIEIFIYTVTGALVYAFVGQDVQSPALLSAGPLISRIAFGIALPVIFISGSINGTVVGRYIMGRVFANSPIRFINTPRAWGIWIALIGVITLIAWIVAEAIPFFGDLLGIISALFISGFSYYFPALFWFQLLKQGKWYSTWSNIWYSFVNGLVLIVGLVVLGLGTYASVQDIVDQYASGSVRGAFTCSQSALS
ncbi:Hypothetical protein R9X50_00796100 [Acrodontium crateriforme]|uniref:Amino acid transporter transmembrane domain-containing protein n=1 Tax=Acrodontium crateriforme TaxID=150365 RepID=A0AAQ3MC71_9PEZI|nr:Hypothetical protein R9X50_00796100 [Acrodontium crateriforme]